MNRIDKIKALLAELYRQRDMVVQRREELASTLGARFGAEFGAAMCSAATTGGIMAKHLAMIAHYTGMPEIAFKAIALEVADAHSKMVESIVRLRFPEEAEFKRELEGLEKIFDRMLESECELVNKMLAANQSFSELKQQGD